MGTLRDEVYENLDYLSQLTEVVIAPQNELLGSIPDRIELSLDDILHVKSRFYDGSDSFILTARSVIRHKCSIDNWDHLSQIEGCFEFEASPDVTIDLTVPTMTGMIALVKKNGALDERRLLSFALESATRRMDSYTWPAKQLKNRVVTVMNTLDPGAGDKWLSTVQGRVAFQAWTAVSNLLKQVILENKWRVRDTAIIQKMGIWINDYLSGRENTTGLVNLMKLKLMVDKDVPVYSIDEVKRVNTVATT